jgi:hypothetical protein
MSCYECTSLNRSREEETTALETERFTDEAVREKGDGEGCGENFAYIGFQAQPQSHHLRMTRESPSSVGPIVWRRSMYIVRTSQRKHARLCGTYNNDHLIDLETPVLHNYTTF